MIQRFTKIRIECNKNYVVHNTFKVKPQHTQSFETMWMTRKSYLSQMPGFVSFYMLKNTVKDGEYISQTTWSDKDSFNNWLNSPQFKESHGLNDPQKMALIRTMIDSMPETSYFDMLSDLNI